jgi:hypothetical protein
MKMRIAISWVLLVLCALGFLCASSGLVTAQSRVPAASKGGLPTMNGAMRVAPEKKDGMGQADYRQLPGGKTQKRQSYRWPTRFNTSPRWTKAKCYACVNAHYGHWWECVPSYCPPPVP